MRILVLINLYSTHCVGSYKLRCRDITEALRQRRHTVGLFTSNPTIASFKPDVVHVLNLGGLSKSLALTLQRLNIPTIFDVSDHWIA